MNHDDELRHPKSGWRLAAALGIADKTVARFSPIAKAWVTIRANDLSEICDERSEPNVTIRAERG